MNKNDDKIKDLKNNAIALMLGWRYYKPKVDIDDSEIGGMYERFQVWARIPIELDEYPESDQYYFSIGWYDKASKNGYYKTKLEYDTDWNELFLAINFIRDLKNYSVHIINKSCFIYDITLFNEKQQGPIISSRDYETSILNTFEAVATFALQYNSEIIF